MRQAPLDLRTRRTATFANIVEGEGNRAALTYLRGHAGWPSPVAIVFGPEGSGKTLLGQAWAGESHGTLLDDADRLPEPDVFDAINTALSGRGQLLLASRHPPADWNTRTPDLRHRLLNTPTFALDEPGEDILRPVTQQLFADHGRDVGEDLLDYMLLRCPRGVRELRRLVADIEDEAQSQLADVSKAWVARYLSRQPELF